MSLKHLIAVGDAGAGDVQAFGVASSLAHQHGGVVDILPIYPDSATDMIALGITLGATLAPEVVEELAAAERELQRRIEGTAREASERAEIVFGPAPGPPRMTVLERGLKPTLALSRHCALTDLVVFGQGHLEHGPGREAFDQCLLADRAPVLIARHEADTLSGPVAIAWDGGPQAGRAVRAALPLLAMASEILILQCINGLDRRGADPDIGPLNAYLRLHGVGEGTAVLVEGDNAGDALIAAAEGRSAGLLIAGGWGHSRLREAVLGGATRSFLLRKHGPSLLLAH
jgi:nucleotide-binding universal stress UspA family protein